MCRSMTQMTLTTEERLRRAQSSLALVAQLHRLATATDVEEFSAMASVAVARLAQDAADDLECVLATLSGVALNTDTAAGRPRRRR